MTVAAPNGLRKALDDYVYTSGHFNPSARLFSTVCCVEELDMQKLAPLLSLKYHSNSDAKLDLGAPEEIRHLFSGFQKYLYQQTA